MNKIPVPYYFEFPICIPESTWEHAIEQAGDAIGKCMERLSSRDLLVAFLIDARGKGFPIPPNVTGQPDQILRDSALRTCFRSLERSIIEQHACPGCRRPGGIN